MKNDESLSVEKLKAVVEGAYKQFGGTSIAATYWIFNEPVHTELNQVLAKRANMTPTDLMAYDYDRTVFVHLTKDGFETSDEEINEELSGDND